MLVIIVAMLVIVAVCVGVVVYVAFPHRGERMPAAPWLGEAMSKAVEALPKLDDDEVDRVRSR